MAYNSEKLQLMEKSLVDVARLIGKKGDKVNEDNFVEGLGLENEAELCLNAADALKEGIFRVVVMGTFKNGKSSIINALIGKRVLPEAVVPATAIISYLRYGDDTNVHVFYQDGAEEIMTTDQFFERFKFNVQDTEECRNTGKVERFSRVRDSVLYSNMPLLENGVQILDTPGLEDKESATKVTMEAAANANAIIYTCSAENGGFNMNDIEFFEANFDNRHLNNIFFLINKSDLKSDSALEQIKAQIKAQLRRVFTDKNGIFDEALYEKRVFFVSAKNTLELKLGELSPSFTERDVLTFQQFETELEEFLTTDARAQATLETCYSKIEDAEESVKHVIDANKLISQKGKAEVEKDIEKAKDILSLSESELQKIQGYFDVATAKTQAIVKNNINGIVTAINDEWDAKLQDIVDNSGFSMMDMVRLAGQAVRYIRNAEGRNAAFQQTIQPVVDGVNSFIQCKIDDAIANIKEETKPVLKELSDQTGASLQQMQEHWEEISTIFAPTDIKDTNPNPEKVSIAKLIGALLNNDVNTTIEVLAGDNIGWGDFLKKTIVQLVLDYLLLLVGGPIGWILFIIKEYIELRSGRNHMVTSLASKSKGQLVAALQKNLDEKSAEMDNKVSGAYLTIYNKISTPLIAKIDDERKLLQSLEEKFRKDYYDFNAEELRCKYILNRIQAIAKTVKP